MIPEGVASAVIGIVVVEASFDGVVKLLGTGVDLVVGEELFEEVVIFFGVFFKLFYLCRVVERGMA